MNRKEKPFINRPAIRQSMKGKSCYLNNMENQQALKLMSSPLTECVKAPTEMKSTPHSA